MSYNTPPSISHAQPTKKQNRPLSATVGPNKVSKAKRFCVGLDLRTTLKAEAGSLGGQVQVPSCSGNSGNRFGVRMHMLKSHVAQNK